jgi:chaperonin GroEL
LIPFLISRIEHSKFPSFSTFFNKDSANTIAVRKIQSILEYVIKHKRSLLIVAEVEQQVKSALLMNKVKGNIKVNIINPPGFGPTKRDTIDDLAFLTGAKVMNEELGDDLDLIEPSCLGEAALAVTDDKQTVLTTYDLGKEFKDRIDNVKKKIKKEDNTYLKKRLEQRLAMLNGSVGIIKVGADSKVELKEKKDRVEDAIYAVKAALKEGIVAGGGIALLNAAKEIENTGNIGEKILVEAIKAPFTTIMANAGIENYEIPTSKGIGYDVTTGELVDMLVSGIVDPALVTKTALKNAISVVKTIISANCVISNIRISHESNK